MHGFVFFFQPYDVVRVGGNVFVSLDSCARNVTLDHDPQEKTLRVEGYFPTPKQYLQEDVQNVLRKRYVGNFSFTADLSKVPGSPPLFEPELVEEEIDDNMSCNLSERNSVIRLKVLQRITTKK